ncbi:MAG: PilZ domain-containing protein, partial [Bdellovibrionales bacterium]|nr:PilZ domain-containing protein [Bdellovibrionales bacterium]
QKLNDWEKEIFQQIYDFRGYEKLFSEKSKNLRSATRFNVNCNGLFTDHQSGQTYFARIYNVSAQGVLCHLLQEPEKNCTEGTLILKISSEKSVQLKLKMVRFKNNQFGAKILASSPQKDWLMFLDYLGAAFNDLQQAS